MRYSLKELYIDLKKVKKRVRSNKITVRSNQFGSKLDEFIYKGPYVKRTKIRESGFFTEFTLPSDGVYNQGKVNDLHLSIIDAHGYAIPHITYKPDGERGVAFHYGIKKQENQFPQFWVTNNSKNKQKDGKPLYDKEFFKHEMKKTYTDVVRQIDVIRYNEYGQPEPPYPFHPLGTVGRGDTTPKRIAGEEISRKRSMTPGAISENAKRRIILDDITGNFSNVTMTRG